MEPDLQIVHRAVCFVDRLIARTVRVEPQGVEPPPALVMEVKHRPYSVPEGFGLLGCKARAFHGCTVRTYPFSCQGWTSSQAAVLGSAHNSKREIDLVISPG